MQPIRTLLAALLLASCALPAAAQTIKTLGYNSTNGNIVYSGTNELTFTNATMRLPTQVNIGPDQANIAAAGQYLSFADGGGNVSMLVGSNVITIYDALNWSASSNKATTRTNLSLGAVWLTNTNVTNFRTAIGLGATNDVVFENIQAINIYATSATNFPVIDLDDHALFSAVTSNTIIDFGGTNVFFAAPLIFNNTTNAATTRTNLGLGLPALTNTSNVTMMRALAGSTNTNEPFSGAFEYFDGTDSYSLTFSNGILLKKEGPL